MVIFSNYDKYLYILKQIFLKATLLLSILLAKPNFLVEASTRYPVLIYVAIIVFPKISQYFWGIIVNVVLFIGIKNASKLGNLFHKEKLNISPPLLKLNSSFTEKTAQLLIWNPINLILLLKKIFNITFTLSQNNSSLCPKLSYFVLKLLLDIS